MRMPDLKRIRADHDAEGGRFVRFCSPLHPNPLVWKHHWRLFTRYSKRDGDAFLTSPHEVLSTAEAMERLAMYRERGETVWIYGGKAPRRDPRHVPFDPDHPKWKNARWAPSWEADTDPVWLSPEGVAYK